MEAPEEMTLLWKHGRRSCIGCINMCPAGRQLLHASFDLTKTRAESWNGDGVRGASSHILRWKPALAASAPSSDTTVVWEIEGENCLHGISVGAATREVLVTWTLLG